MSILIYYCNAIDSVIHSDASLWSPGGNKVAMTSVRLYTEFKYLHKHVELAMTTGKLNIFCLIIFTKVVIELPAQVYMYVLIIDKSCFIQ